MKKNSAVLIVIMVGLELGNAFAQGFVNLDFEDANLAGYGAGSVPATNAIPGWTAYLGGVPLTNINYNISTTFSGYEVDILGANSGYASIEGNYYLYLQGDGSTLIKKPASIGQIGTIPLSAQSLIFWGDSVDSGEVSFNGKSLSLSILGQTANYTIYGANISSFAGQTGQLLFSSIYYPAGSGFAIDNIQFSSSPVPEPSVFGLFGLGGLLLAGSLFHRNARRSH